MLAEDFGKDNGVVLKKATGEVLVVHNCANRLKYPTLFPDVGETAGWFENQRLAHCRALSMLGEAWPSRTSALKAFRIDARFPDHVSSAFSAESWELRVAPENGAAAATWASAQKLRWENDAFTTVLSDEKALREEQSMQLEIEGFGDVDHDGAEDVVIRRTLATWDYAPPRTLLRKIAGPSDVVALSGAAVSGLFRIIARYVPGDP